MGHHPGTGVHELFADTGDLWLSFPLPGTGTGVATSFWQLPPHRPLAWITEEANSLLLLFGTLASAYQGFLPAEGEEAGSPRDPDVPRLKKGAIVQCTVGEFGGR